MKKGLGIGALVAVAFGLGIAFATVGSRGGGSEAVAAEATLDDEAASMGHASADAQEASIPRITCRGGRPTAESLSCAVEPGALPAVTSRQ